MENVFDIFDFSTLLVFCFREKGCGGFASSMFTTNIVFIHINNTINIDSLKKYIFNK